MEIGTTLYVKYRRQWQAWLAKHHKTAPETWRLYDKKHRRRRDGAVTQLTLSTASMKLNVLVSTHSTDTASTFIVPMRSVLLVTARPLVGDGLMSRATAMPRRGSHLNVSVEASAVPAGVCGVNMSATVGYPPAVAVSSSMAAWWPAFLRASMNRSSTERTTVRRRSPHVRRRRSPSSCAGFTATCNFAVRSS